MEPEANEGFRPGWAFLFLSGVAIIVIAGGILVSCQPSKPDPNIQNLQIQSAVAATIASIPTYTPYPLPTAYPTLTPVSLSGIFCEYMFCIGHPKEIYLVDANTIKNPAAPSSYDNGILFGFSPSLFVQVVWTLSGPNYDPQQNVKYILEGSEKINGDLNPEAIGDLTVYTQSITTVSNTLAYGAVATWQCGGRDFAWKVYTPQDGMAPALLQAAMTDFRCETR